jgi:hypothetical protein
MRKLWDRSIKPVMTLNNHLGKKNSQLHNKRKDLKLQVKKADKLINLLIIQFNVQVKKIYQKECQRHRA